MVKEDDFLESDHWWIKVKKIEYNPKKTLAHNLHRHAKDNLNWQEHILEKGYYPTGMKSEIERVVEFSREYFYGVISLLDQLGHHPRDTGD